jgi:hypothetical protein
MDIQESEAQEMDYVRPLVGALAAIKKKKKKRRRSHVFQAAYFVSSLAQRNVGVISKFRKSEVPNVPPPYVGASKEEEGVNVVRK